MKFNDLFKKPDPIARGLEGCTALGDVERFLAEEGHVALVGVDEVGRGALAGPVTVCAAFLGPLSGSEDWLETVNDSKKLTSARRAQILANLPDYVQLETALSSPERIDEVGIRVATREAMDRAVSSLLDRLQERVDYILVDGGTDPLMIDGTPQVSFTKGDARSYNIAVASICAKETRDRDMRNLAESYPVYGFESHAGYGTKAHCSAIAEFGPCEVHRKTFGRVREYVE